MNIGAPREAKIHDYRVGLVPGPARERGMRALAVPVEQDRGAAIRRGMLCRAALP